MKRSISELIARAARDAQLKDELKKDPKKVLAQQCQVILHEECKVDVLENTSEKVHFFLPSERNANDIAYKLKELKNPQAPLFQKLTNKEFRSQFLKNPKEIFERECNVTLPEDCHLAVIEEAPNTLYLVIPSDVDELTDDQLSQITGGIAPFANVGAILSVGTTVGLIAGVVGGQIYDTTGAGKK